MNKNTDLTRAENVNPLDAGIINAEEKWSPSSFMQTLIDEPSNKEVEDDYEFKKFDALYTKDGEVQNHLTSHPKQYCDVVSVQPNFAKRLIDVASKKDGPFFHSDVASRPRSSAYVKANAILHKLIKMIDSSNDVFEVSEHQKLFDRKMKEAGFVADIWCHIMINQLMDTTKVLVLDALNKVIEQAVEESKTEAFRDKLRKREQNAQRRIKSCQMLLANAFDFHSRLLVLRLDFHIKKHHRDSFTPEIIGKEFQKFTTGLQERKKLSKGFVGYIGVLEYGVSQHYHVHAILLYSAAERNNAFSMAKLLLEYWEEVTDGRGYGYDCARSKYEKLNNGIGEIHYTDEAKLRELFHVVVPYICKRDKYFRVLPGNGRGFWRSVLRDKALRYVRSRPGRPRQSAVAPTLLAHHRLG